MTMYQTFRGSFKDMSTHSRISCPVRTLILASLTAFCISGCGGGGGDVPDLGTVTGTVTLGGAPLADAQVVFQPTKGRPSSGVTDSDGYYELIYNADNNGATVGTHKVSISTYREESPDDGSDDIIVPESVPAVYNTDTTLTSQVEAGSNEFDFALEEGEVIQPGEENDDDDDE